MGYSYKTTKLNILTISLVCIDGRFFKIQSHTHTYIHRIYDYNLYKHTYVATKLQLVCFKLKMTIENQYDLLFY